jgi:hypothetical protein
MTEASLILYDASTLHFEIDAGDGFREPGFSKERRLDLQITIGAVALPGVGAAEIVNRGWSDRHDQLIEGPCPSRNKASAPLLERGRRLCCGRVGEHSNIDQFVAEISLMVIVVHADGDHPPVAGRCLADLIVADHGCGSHREDRQRFGIRAGTVDRSRIDACGLPRCWR